MEQYSFRTKDLRITNDDLIDLNNKNNKYNFEISLNVEARSDNQIFDLLSQEDKEKYYYTFAKNLVTDYLNKYGFEKFYNHVFHNFALNYPLRNCVIDLVDQNNQPISTELAFEIPTINTLKIKDSENVILDYNRKNDISFPYNVFNEEPFKVPTTNLELIVTNSATLLNKTNEIQPTSYKYNIYVDALSNSKSKTENEIRDCLTQSIVEYFKDNHPIKFNDSDYKTFVQKYLKGISSKSFNSISIKGTVEKINSSTNETLLSKQIDFFIGAFLLHQEQGLICW